MTCQLGNLANETVRHGACLLCIGVVSQVVIEAALEVADEEACPLIFIASRNQVDCEDMGGGYVRGWNQAAFRHAVESRARRSSCKHMIYVCRDHGGPWQSDREKTLSYDEAKETAFRSYAGDLAAGFDLIHIDHIKELRYQGFEPMLNAKTIADALGQIEEIRERLGANPVAYEVRLGVDPFTDGYEKQFSAELDGLVGLLKSRGLPKPTFVEAYTGAVVEMDANASRFCRDCAQSLADICRKHGVYLKQHNADYLSAEIIRSFPSIPIPAANVAPEFGAAETDALLGLCRETGDDALETVLVRHLISDTRWHKWLSNGCTPADVTSDSELRRRLLRTASHYYSCADDVIRARYALYESAVKLGITNPDRIIVDRVKAAVQRYVEAFRLSGLIHKIGSRSECR